jgi:aryl-alcohol dehydrogenase-like predicted oxidoreductase
MKLTDYRTLGRSGLAVSPLALGAMTFGTQRWGADEAASRAIFDTYVEAGGNFVDTADVYSGGRSEEMLGRFLKDSGRRESLVLATKAGFATGDHPHAGGNGVKHIHDALDGSLRRLATDHVDLYWLHVWDMVTPAEEVLQTMAALVRAGKVRHWGISNAPAWYVAKIATLAAAHALPRPVGLQFEYSLAQRGVENEHVPLALEFGLGLQPWSPLAGGFLTGKYRRDDPANAEGQRGPALPDGKPDLGGGENRLAGANPFGDSKFNARNWDVLDVLRSVADEVGASPAHVALAWVIGRPGVSSVLIGASRAEQVSANIASLDVELTASQRRRLDEASAPEAIYPSVLFTSAVQRFVFGGHNVRG